jgi:hypothetical protein
MDGDVERKSVTVADVKTGVYVRPGDRVVLRVSDAGAYVIEVQLHASGGTPLANERVRIHDPDTGEQVGEPRVTDDKGVLKAQVPAKKKYEIHIDADVVEAQADAFADVEHPLPAHLPDPEGHGVLHVAFVDAQGAPLADEPVKATGGDGAALELRTDERGRIEIAVEHGVFTLEARGASFVGHSVLSGDVEGDDAPYEFVVPQ